MLKFENCPRLLPAVRGIYLIKNIVTGMKYVGSSNNVRARVIGHMRKLINSKHDNRYLQAAWNVDGRDAFRWALIEIVASAADLATTEAVHIAEFHAGFGDGGYNLVINPGTGSLADDVRRRMSETRKGQRAWNKGVPCPEHVKQASRTLLKGRIKTPEEIAKISLAMLGPSHPFRGKKYSAEHCRKVSVRVRKRGPLSGLSKGVNFDSRTKTFMARIYSNKKQIFLGRYPTEMEASQAYNIAAVELFGGSCFLNAVSIGMPLRRTSRGRPAREVSHGV
jgi:group I intron endonuclease